MSQAPVPTMGWAIPGLLSSSILCHRRGCPWTWGPSNDCPAPPWALVVELSSYHTLRMIVVGFSLGERAEITHRSLLRGLSKARDVTATESPSGSTGPSLQAVSLCWMVLTEQLCKDHRTGHQCPLLVPGQTNHSSKAWEWSWIASCQCGGRRRSMYTADRSPSRPSVTWPEWWGACLQW